MADYTYKMFDGVSFEKQRGVSAKFARMQMTLFMFPG